MGTQGCEYCRGQAEQGEALEGVLLCPGADPALSSTAQPAPGTGSSASLGTRLAGTVAERWVLWGVGGDGGRGRCWPTAL